MEKRQLFGAMDAFVAVATLGSFSQAARKLGLSQPSVSRMVSELEAHVGVRLLQRSTRKLSLTEAGQIYLGKSRKIQQDVLDAQQSLDAFKKTPSGLLKIGAPLHWVDLTIAPFMAEFLGLYPDIQMQIIATDQHQDIVEDNLDVVLRVGDPKHVTYIAVPIAPVTLTLCASPEYLEKFGSPTSIGQLAQHNCLTYNQMNHWQIQADNQLEQIQVKGNIDANTVTVLIANVVQGVGITLLPDLLVKEHIENKTLQSILPQHHWQIKHAVIENMYALYSDRKHLAAKTRVFIDFFKEKIQQEF